jgi:protein TonB
MLSLQEQGKRDRAAAARRKRYSRPLTPLIEGNGTGEVDGLSERDGLVDSFGDTWDEIVFEGRNQAYGAYVLRGRYHTNVAIGIVITVLVVTFLLLTPLLSKWFGARESATTSPRMKLVYSELSAPPPIDKTRPVPPSVQLPRLQKVIKFVPPKVVKEDIAEQVATLEEIKANDIGAKEIEGPAEVVFQEPVEEVVADDNELFTVVDQQPEFEGGYAAMMAFVKSNMKYPANARRMRIEGTVHISFIVSKTGAISDVQVLRGFMTECDREAVRVVKLMPDWKPGKQNGRNVNVRFILPLKFTLD